MNQENIKSTQEQAVASWIQYLNTIRLEKLLDKQDENLDEAIKSLDNALNIINEQIEHNRGGAKGIHGFIAEVSEVGIGNAKEKIVGNNTLNIWINDNGPVDIKRYETGGRIVNIQTKFYQKDLSLDAILEHLKKYPNYLKEGGKYQIPKDQYERIMYLRSIPESEANKIGTSDGTFSLRQWKKVNEFFKEGPIDINSIEPANLEYSEVQRDVIDSTIDREKNKIKETDKEIRDKINDENKPTFNKGVKVAAVSSVVEGGTTFISLLIKKKKEKKLIKNFTSEDWQEIIKDSGISTIKGGIRGASLYAITSHTKTPAAVANALVTSSFGIANQIYLYNKGIINKNDLIENSELLCIDASVSALSSLLGQTIIPIPMIGAIIGNTIGMKMYESVKDCFKEEDKRLIQNYCDEIGKLEKELAKDYNVLLEKVKQEMLLYMEILEKLYSVDVNNVFEGSIKIAEFYGIPSNEILDSKEKIDTYFSD